jgi:hypothetical protein
MSEIVLDNRVHSLTGSLPLSSIVVTAANSPFVIPNAAEVVFVDSRDGPISLVIPPDGIVLGRELLIKDRGGAAGTNPITISASNGALIERNPTYNIEIDSAAAALVMDGIDVYLVGQNSAVIPYFNISAFNSPEELNEVGATITDPTFTASYTEPPDSASVVDNQGNPTADVSSTPLGFTYAHEYTKTVNNSSVSITLSAVKGSASSGKGLSMYWRPKVFWGVGPNGLSTEADIEGLTNQPLLSSRVLTFTASPGAAEHIYYACPETYGAATFTVDGWEGGFDLVGIVSVTNAHGVIQNYRLYKSTNPNLGTTVVGVT